MHAQPLIICSPKSADTDPLVAQLLAQPRRSQRALAHIRFATVGQVDEANCHPFSATDDSGRCWTLIHKGTIFDYEPLNPYFHCQQGTTDSERILLLFIDKIDAAMTEKGAPLEADERFEIFTQVVEALSPGNCVNLILYDSHQFYIYTNYQGALNMITSEEQVIFSTAELSTATAADALWKPVPLCTPLAYRLGVQVLAGAPNPHEYLDNDKDTRFLYQDFASL
jgi:glutamine amidotransferase